MNSFDIKEHPHSRINLLTGEWVLVSPQRTKRPWQGKVEDLPANNRPAYDPACYLCPGNTRADGSKNPVYENSFVFTNDFSALLADTPEETITIGNLLQAKSEKGICRVISFSPDHSLTLPQMTVEAIERVVEVWQKEFAALAANPAIKYIQIFENKGEIMGCSNPHPHGQIWAQGSLPVEIVKEQMNQGSYFEAHGTSLLNDYLKLELEQQERIVIENEHFVALSTLSAGWPYETMIVSKRQVQNVTQFSEAEKHALAAVLKELTVRYDNLFRVSFPYSAGMHQAPVNSGEQAGWHWHMHFYPPLLRSATVKKFMVGYEMLANPQRDITPEWAAGKLRETSALHYTVEK